MDSKLLLDSLLYLFKEITENRKNILLISLENMRQQTLRTSLGLGWIFFRDIIYYVVFILFRLVMSGSGEIEGMHFILFLLLGIIPWNFMSECINGGVMAIKGNKNIISSMKFPSIILPIIEVLAIFIKRLFTLIVLLMVVMFFGNISDITIWMFLYYFFSMFICMCSWNLVFSSLVGISNDFEQLYKAFSSILFYSIPIIWSFDVFNAYPTVTRIIKLNPFIYIVEGFRDACVTGTLPDLQYTIYFWVIVLVMTSLGSVLQYKLKNHYIDLI